MNTVIFTPLTIAPPSCSCTLPKVNTGELLRRWSNDVVQPALHFADNRSGVEDRVSIPFFFNANADHVCECLPSCPATSTSF